MLSISGRQLSWADGGAARLALSALVLARKRTPAAASRCKKLSERALGRLLVTPIVAGMPDPQEAADVLRKVCETCGRCGGI